MPGSDTSSVSLGMSLSSKDLQNLNWVPKNISLQNMCTFILDSQRAKIPMRCSERSILKRRDCSGARKKMHKTTRRDWSSCRYWNSRVPCSWNRFFGISQCKLFYHRVVRRTGDTADDVDTDKQTPQRRFSFSSLVVASSNLIIIIFHTSYVVMK